MSLDRDVVELPASMIPAGFDENSHVQVAALATLEDADNLNVEPLTCEDWELLETRAEFLEEGALLRQVSVVYPGQVLDLWVGAKDSARIRVIAENFGVQKDDSPWPPLPDEENVYEDISSPSRCLRLVRDTRVCVTPKPRAAGDRRSSHTSPPMQVYPTKDDYSKPMNDIAEALGQTQIKTTPGTAVVHPTIKAKIAAMDPDDTSALVVIWGEVNGPQSPNAQQKNSCVVKLVFSDEVPDGHIALHHLTRSRLQVVALVDSVYFRVLSPIEVARGSTLMTCDVEGTKKPWSLALVRIHEERQRGKWRYPFVDESRQRGPGAQASSSLFNFLFEVSPQDAGEPVEDGSFLVHDLVEKSAPGMPTVYRVTSTCEARESFPPASATEDSPADRCFVFREDLSEVVNIEVDLPVISYGLLSTPNLLNLLPETSLIPQELSKYLCKKGVMFDALVFGDKGSGKTHTSLVLAAVKRFTSGGSTFYLDCKSLKEGRGIRMKQILSEIKDVFLEAAKTRWHSVVILDGLDELAPNMTTDSGGDDNAQSQQVNPVAVSQAKLIGDTVRSQIERCPAFFDQRVSIIVTCRDASSLYPGILAARPFSLRVEAPNLGPRERETLLWRIVVEGTRWSKIGALDEAKSLRIGRKSEGYGPRDLHMLASRVRQVLRTTEGEVAVGDVPTIIRKAMETFSPLRKLSVQDEASEAVEWSDIGGLVRAKESLIKIILNPSKYRRIYEKANIRLPRGVLLFGLPGGGKSILVPSLAKKCGFPLIMCRGPELLDRYIGASEAKVRELFARASAAAPSILFFDEIDSLAPKRGSDKTGVTDRVVNQLLTLLDGVESKGANGNVYVVAATSRPDTLDPALLRPGRLEKHVYVGLPESEEEYNDLLLKIASGYKVDAHILQSISSGQLVRFLKDSVQDFHRLSAADWKASFDTAHLNAIHEILETDPTTKDVIIKQHHLHAAMQSTRPSLPDRDYQMLMKAYLPFLKDAKIEAGGLFSASEADTEPRELKTALRY